jgi:DNA-binding LacI/PurR family transcriptional regulator
MKRSGPRRSGIVAVAHLAGVSVGTVSNVVNHPELVSEATRTRVERAIDDLGWSPNLAGVALRRGSEPRRLALLVPPLIDADAAAFVSGVLEELQRHDVAALLWNVEDAEGVQRRFAQAANGTKAICVVARARWLHRLTLLSIRSPNVVLSVFDAVGSAEPNATERYVARGAELARDLIERLFSSGCSDPVERPATPAPLANDDCA